MGAVLSAGVIYASEQGGVFALRTTDGTPLWHAALTDDANADAVTTPFIASGTVYTIATNKAQETLYALNAEDGRVLWHDSLPAVRVGQYPLAVVGGVVLYAAVSIPPSANTPTDQQGAYVSALRASDGHKLWQSWIGGYGRPAIRVDHAAVYVVAIITPPTNVLKSLQVNTGKQLWQAAITDSN